MRTAILYGMVMLSVTATPSSAAGLHLRWTTCDGEGGVQHREFACATNTGTHVIAGSFVLDEGVQEVVGDELVVDIETASSTLPEWWRFRSAGACRSASLSVSPLDAASCPDVFESLGSLCITSYTVGLGGANSARIVSVGTTLQSSIFNLYSAQEYGLARWTIDNLGTTGAGACGGCTTPACIVFNSARLIAHDALDNMLLTGPAESGSNYVVWQGGAGPNCPASTPARNVTWGAVKSLYR